MKKIKIMLLSLALFAIVGGALAFKAKFSVKYCTTFAIQNAAGAFTCPVTLTCSQSYINVKTTAAFVPVAAGGLATLATTFCTTAPPYLVGAVPTCTTQVPGQNTSYASCINTTSLTTNQ